MSRLIPEGAAKYAETEVFDEHSVPNKLTSRHSTKPGTWGKLCILSGSLKYVICDGDANEATLSGGEHGVILPQQPHFVEMSGPVKFKIEFYRIPQQG